MITFLLGLTLGIIFGATGLVCVAIIYNKHQYIPMNPKDFYGYRRKTVAVLYERMRLLGVWEE